MVVPTVHVKVNTWQSVIVQLADCQQSLTSTSLGQLVSTTHHHSYLNFNYNHANNKMF